MADIPYAAKATSVASEVQALKKANPHVVMQASYTSDAILFTNTFQELDYNPLTVLAMDAGHIDSAHLQTVKEKGEYIFSREVWALDFSVRKPMVATVNDMFITPWDGVKFDPATGQNVLGKGIIVQVQDQKYWTVWPLPLASKDLVWPMPTWKERK